MKNASCCRSLTRWVCFSLLRWLALLGPLSLLGADCGRQADAICTDRQKITGCTLGKDCDWCEDNVAHHCSGWGEHDDSSCPAVAPCTTAVSGKWTGTALCVERASCDPGQGPYCDASTPDITFECVSLADGSTGRRQTVCSAGETCGKSYYDQVGCH